VNGNIALELKSRKRFEADSYKQLRTYLNQSDEISIGLLLNFYNKSLEYKRLEKDYKKISLNDEIL
jgi:GxxExxY protein